MVEDTAVPTSRRYLHGTDYRYRYVDKADKKQKLDPETSWKLSVLCDFSPAG